MRRSVGLIVTCLVVVVFGVNANAATNVRVSMKTVSVGGAGISVSYPRSWVVIPHSKADILKSRQVQSFVRSNPNAAAELERLESTGITSPNWKFVAVDLAGANAGHFVGSLQVIVDLQDGFPSDLGEVRKAMAQNAASLSGNLVSTSAVQVGGEDSYEAVIRIQRGAQSAREGVLLIPQADGGVFVAAGAADDANGRALIKSMLNGVALS